MFPGRKQGELRKHALSIVQKVPELKARPLILANIELLVRGKVQFTYLSQIYEAMVQRWLDREIHPDLLSEKERALLDAFSERLAVALIVRDKYSLPARTLLRFADRHKIPLQGWQLRGRSLLNRDAAGNYKFAHRSFTEFFVARCIVRGRCRKRNQWSALVRRFVEEIVRSGSESPMMVGVTLTDLDLHGLKLSGTTFRAVRLRRTNFQYADLCGADFRGADLEDVDFTGAILNGARFGEANLGLGSKLSDHVGRGRSS
jgi:hypothetical protein